ncbi:LysR family transcriptional regulator [Streptomyces sp. SID8375]|uniref:LysR family transcriptional regulator n=1 Tax=Streptomyces TaxID=1883 RepID=UPI00036F612E|nr:MULTISPECIES: LysR family transcriptional regulator [Streptomyces]MCX5447489.1 LysR family transcriptional regulator [Streptomyces libani]MCX5447734.1 LysR family transcriptional regulator [Streptomyces libani]MYX05323.1 LysR family transcriptional regulator [Streptomyces sp. SID8375]
MIDPRLQTLRVLHERGTVTATAEALHLTPSTVSQQLRQLSARLGLELLEPAGRTIRLTPAALALVEHADALFARWEEARADLAGHADGVAGRLRITGVATAIAGVIAPAAARLREELPRLAVEIGEDPGENRFELLLAGRADIAVVIPAPGSPSPDDARFAQQPLLEEPQDLLVPAGHRFAGRAAQGVALAEAGGESWIRAGDPADQHQLLLTACATAGFTPRVRHDAVDWYAVAALVAHGFGICLVPRLAPVPERCPVVRVPLRGEPLPVRRFLAAVRRGSARQPPVARGLAALRAAAGEREAKGV